MAKLPHQTVPPAVDDIDIANKAYADASGGGGGGATAAAQGDFIHANVGANYASVLNSPMDIDTLIDSRGELAVDGAGRFSGLKAGRTYRLTGYARILTNSAFNFQWRNITAGAYVGNVGIAYTPNNSGANSSMFVAVAYVQPDVDTEVELWSQTAGVTVSSFTHAVIEEIGAVQAEVIGGLEFMDIITVEGTAASSVTFGSGGDGKFGRAIDGDVDQEYVLVSRVGIGGTAATVDIQPNAIGTNQVSRRITHQSSTVTFSRLVISQPSADGFEYSETSIDAKTGRERSYHTRGAFQNTAPATAGGQFIRSYAGTWDETATNITSLVIKTDDGSAGIDVGSEFILYRRTRSNLRADSASLYERNVEAVVNQGTAADVTYTSGSAVFGGSAVGVSVALVDDTVVSGSIDVTMKVATIGILTATLDSTNTSFHRAAAPIGAHAVAAGDALEVDITTTSLVTTNGGSPAVSINCMLTANAFTQAPTGSDYLIAALSADQTTNLTVGNHIEFDSIGERAGQTSIALATGAGQANGLFTLQPGKTYEISVNLSANCNEGNAEVRWYNNAGDTELVDDTGVAAGFFWFRDNAAHDTVVHPAQNIILTPSVATTIKLEITGNTNLTRFYTGSRVIIKELK